MPALEILGVESDPSTNADGFDPTKDIIIEYLLDGVNCRDTPASLNLAILAHPERYPENARSLIAIAVRTHEKSLKEQCSAVEVLSTVQDPEDVPTASLEASMGDVQGERFPPAEKEGRNLIAEAESINKFLKIGQDQDKEPAVGARREKEVPRAESNEQKAAEAPPRSTKKQGTKAQSAEKVRRRRFRLHKIRRGDNGEVLVDAEIDGERREWSYTDLETEFRDHQDQYAVYALETLQDKLKTWTSKQKVTGQTKGVNPALRLVDIAKQGDRTEFFHDVVRTPYARIERAGHHEVRALRDPEFAEWLAELTYDIEGLAPEETAAKRAIATLTVLAKRGEERPVYLRHGEHDGAFYYDLCNDQGQAVCITPDRWDVVNDPPAMFRRYDHMRPQVAPIRPTGDHWALKKLVQMANISQVDRDVFEVQLHVLMVPSNEQMGGGSIGPEGSGKTSVQRLACATCDPTTDVESSLPKRENDLSLHLSTHSMGSFDNLRKITADQSDYLSRGGTGATDTMRELYSNNGTNRRKYCTPSFFNGICITGALPDFYDRNIIYRTLDSFDQPLLSKEDFTHKVEELMPYALGEIFDNLSKAMSYRSEFDNYKGWTPRMSGWYRWALAVAKAMGRPDGWFEGIFRPMVKRRDYEAIAEHPLTKAMEFVAEERGFVGTASELYAHITDPEKNIPFLCQINTRDRNWPISAGSFGMKIKPLIKSLRSHDVFIYKRQWTNLKKYRDALKGLDRAHIGLENVIYRDSDDLYVVSNTEIDLGRDDEVNTGGK